MTDDPTAQALAEYRAAFPEDDDLPDEAVSRLFVVQRRALGIALTDLWHTIRAEVRSLVQRRA